MCILFQPCPHFFRGIQEQLQASHTNSMAFPSCLCTVTSSVLLLPANLNTPVLEQRCWCSLEMLLCWDRHFSALTVKEPRVQVLVRSIQAFRADPGSPAMWALLPDLSRQRSSKVNGLCLVFSSPPPCGPGGRNGGVPPPAPRAGQQTKPQGWGRGSLLPSGGERRGNKRRLDAVTPEAPRGSQPAERGLTADPERALFCWP